VTEHSPGGRRLVRHGDEFTSDELDRGEVELELPEPAPEPAEDAQAEPWALSPEHQDRHARSGLADRARLYREFLASPGTGDEGP
jgi:hypothetical protein